MVVTGDLVVDGSGVFGMVIDVTETNVRYKAYTHDGTEFVYDTPPNLVTQVGEKMKRVWLGERRKMKWREESAQWDQSN